MTLDPNAYSQLLFERRDDGVLLITINNPEKYNATDEQLHGELARVWNDVSRDPETRVAVITGAGKAFSAGGDLEMVERLAGDHERVSHMLTEMSPLGKTWQNCKRRQNHDENTHNSGKIHVNTNYNYS